MNSLVDAYGSESASDSEHDVSPQQEKFVKDKGSNGRLNISMLKSYCDNSDEGADDKNISGFNTRQKRIRDDHDNGNETAEQVQVTKQSGMTFLLPAPPIITSTTEDAIFSPFTSLVLFEHDFLTEEIQRYHNQQEPTHDASNIEKEKKLEDKLDQMYKTFYGEASQQSSSEKLTQSFSDHLKHQKEFRNPAMFQSIIKEFGIDPFGTNFPPDCWNPRVDFSSNDFYDQVRKREEENRIRSFGGST